MQSPLITPDELRRLLQSGGGVVLLDARPDRNAYEDSHLEGALYASLNRDLSAASEPGFDPARGGRHPLPAIERWAATLGGWGIGPESAVVVYDERDGSNAAARAWWMLRAFGHSSARVLDGGWNAAMEAGLPVEGGVGRPRPREPYPAAEWQRPVVDVQTVDRLRESPEWKLLDVRSAPRFRGETEPIDPVAGHIQGAVNLFFGENMEGGRFKSPVALRQQYLQLLGGLPPERLVVHCGSGVTACHTLLALDAAGLPGAALYVGSWSEWCRNDLPSEP